MTFYYLYIIKNNKMIMKQIKKFDDFKEINENVFTDIWKNIVSTYKKLKEKYGKNAWQEYNKNLAAEDDLPKGVEIFSPVMISESIDTVNEDKVSLEHPDQEIFNADANELMEEIEYSYKLRVDSGELTSMFIWGGPGIGKTDIVKQIAKKLDIELIVFHLSQIDPTDFRGLPIVLDIDLDEEAINKLKADGKETDGKVKRSGSALPLVFPTSNGKNGKGGILFLDEMNLAPDIVLKAAMPLALDGSYEGYDLPSKWIIISAGNRAEDVPDTDLTEIRGALGNRFLHLNYVATVEGWTDWAKSKEFMDPMLIAFLNFKPDWFHKLEGEDEQSSVWPSPRTWAEASFITYQRSNKTFKLPLKMKKRIYQMAVGFSAMNAFMQYEELSSIISEQDIKDIYKTGKIPKKLPTRPDHLNAVLNTIAYYKTGKKLTPKELDNLFNFAGDLTAFEYSTSFMAAIKAAHIDKEGRVYYKTDPKMKDIYDKHITDWFDKYGKMVSGEDL